MQGTESSISSTSAYKDINARDKNVNKQSTFALQNVAGDIGDQIPNLQFYNMFSKMKQ